MALAAVIAWTVFAFGGIHPGTLVVPAIICTALTLVCRPALLQNSDTPRVDLWCVAAVGAMLLQLIPLPRTVLQAIAPGTDAIARTRLLVDRGGPLPISIDPSSTAYALALFAGVFVYFAAARHVFSRGGVRTITRVMAIISLILSGLALAQSATAHGLMYWRWRPADEGPDPFGPFVNRNHFATWAVMAIPLLAGYLAAHAFAHRAAGPEVPWRRRVAAAIDARAWILLASTTMLIVALARSLSRSGLVGLAAAMACGAFLGSRGPRADRGNEHVRRSGRAVASFAVLAALAIFAVSTQVGPGVIAERFGTSRGAMADRLTIWHDTVPVLRDFWLTGTGAGTYLTSMAVYQRSKPGVIFNQAHNHYVQVAAEGGVLLALPVVLAAAAFARAAAERLTADHSGMYWIRAGAAAGLFGAAVQSVWETGLTIPANAALAAILAAIVIHVPLRAGVRA